MEETLVTLPLRPRIKIQKDLLFRETRTVVGILINDQDIPKLGTTSFDLSRNEKSFSLNLGICPTRRTTAEEYNSFACMMQHQDLRKSSNACSIEFINSLFFT